MDPKILYLSSVIEGLDDENRKRKNNILYSKRKLIYYLKKLKLIALNRTRLQHRIAVPKVENYAKIIELFNNDVFRSHFRMPREAFLKLHSELQVFIKTKRKDATILSKNALYITIWTLSNQDSFREIADRFNVSKSTAFLTVLNMCKLIGKLMPTYIKWPKTVKEINTIVQGFNEIRKTGFPNVIGCIDGCHVTIKAPIEDPSSYYNRKGFHSMILQAVCKSDASFTNVFFGWPGRCHDAYVFENSSLGKRLNKGQISLPPDTHIIGDSAYKLTTFLMTPFKDNGHLSVQQNKYNQELSSTRVIIEQAFRLLKSKFRILNSLQFNKLRNIKTIVLACLVLHNFIIKEDNETVNFNNYDDDFDEDNHQVEDDIPMNDEHYYQNLNSPQIPQEKRNGLVQLISS